MRDKLNNFLNLFYNSTRIPISLFQYSGKLIKNYSNEPDLHILPVFKLTTDDKNPSIYTCESHGFYGIIKLNDNNSIVQLGPCFNIPVTDSIIRAFMRENVISLVQREQVSHLLSATLPVHLSQFINKLIFLHFCLNDGLIIATEHFSFASLQKLSDMNKQALSEEFDKKEYRSFHNTYYWEQALYHIIQKGDTLKLKEFLFSNLTELTEGFMANTPLRQAKNIFIGTVTKVGVLGAIPGGLNVEQTYELIDIYTRECEQTNSIEEIHSLIYTMMMDFCRRLSDINIPQGISKEVFICIEYIRNHTNESISISNVANQIHRSNSYVIKLFKKELGINTGAFIIHCKLEEAKSLLTYSEKTLSEISSYLCFSTQSYFQNVFKKKYGITPMQYRKKRGH